MKLMKLNQKELTKELKGMTGHELLTMYNSLKYMHRISTNGKLIWEMILRSSGSREYKSVHR
mgnify:CR=1 FL=1|jgi:hypothetical protein